MSKHKHEVEETEEKPAKKKHEKLLGDVKANSLFLEGELALEIPDQNDKSRTVLTGLAWPAWVTQAMTMLRAALAKLGIDLSKVEAEHPDDLLEEVTTLVESSPPGWQRFVVLAALTWVKTHMAGGDVKAVLVGA